VNALFVVHTPKDPQTAVFKVVAEHADALRARGHHVEIIAPEDFTIARLVGPRFNPLLFPVLIAIRLLQNGRNLDLIKFHSYSGWLFALLRPIRDRWRKIRIVTEFHGLEPLYFAALQEEARHTQRPLSWRYRLINGWFMNQILRVACRRSDRVLCLNSKEIKYVASNAWTAPSHIATFKNGVPSEFFEIRRNYQGDPATLLFVGQWNNRKGIRYLVEAFTQIAGEHPELKLICVGTLLNEQSVLHDFAAHIRSRVSVHSRVTRSELIQLHTAADIFALPTLFEGSSLALLEAMASALPIVTTSVGAAPDILQDQTSVVLVPTRNSTALANAISNLIGDAEMRAQLGTSARTAAQEYRLDSALTETAAQLEDLVLGPAEQAFTPDRISAAPARN
jgi:glycosyltransferase involved in cell wall biosynthesis